MLGLDDGSALGHRVGCSVGCEDGFSVGKLEGD